MITTHARKEHRYGTTVYVGYIKVTDGPAKWTESTRIASLTKMDALLEAERLKQHYITPRT